MSLGICTTLKRLAAGGLALSLVAAPLPNLQPAAHAYLTDTGVHAPPGSGPYAYYPSYGAFGPDQSSFPRVGGSYVDPVFGSTVRRLTNELGHHSFSEIYSKNGFFNANGTLVHHRTPSGHNIISTRTGQVVRASVKFNSNSSFAPDDPDAWYYWAYGDTTLYKYSVSTGNRTVVKTFPGALGQLGGSTDWIDRTGRYMVLSIGGASRVYDKVAGVLYAGAIPGSYGGSGGWVSISPDGNYVITSTPPRASHSWRIDHARQTVSTTPVLFWTLCGGHADVVSASNGKTYFVSYDCQSTASVYAVDVTLPQSSTNVAQQLSQNRKLFQASWSDSGHFSRVSRGALRDWMFISVESGDDGFSSTTASWRPLKQEILMVNVLTGALRRLAHHRSRGLSESYYYQPRVSASWDGNVVLWTSNMGYSSDGYADLYAVDVASASYVPPPPSGTLTVSFVNPGSGATVSGTTNVLTSAQNGTGYTYSVTASTAAGTRTVYAGTNNGFAWNTTASPNGSCTLTARVTDSAGRVATATRTVTISNTTSIASDQVVTITATDPSATEAGLTTGTFTVRRTGTVTAPLTVKYTAGGTATKDADRRSLAGSVTIAAGATAATIVVTPVDDTLREGAETVVVTLLASAGYTVGSPGSATVTIADND